jgi:hypothetical protein
VEAFQYEIGTKKERHPWRTFIALELAPLSAVLTAEHVVHQIAAPLRQRRRARRIRHPVRAGGGDPCGVTEGKPAGRRGAGGCGGRRGWCDRR